MKRCPRCKRTRRLSSFGPDRSRPDGHYCYCRECKREMSKIDNARRHEEKKAWQRRMDRSPEGRGTCESCGGPMGVGMARRDSQNVCFECKSAEADRKMRDLERLWNQGKTISECATELGWSFYFARIMVYRGREKGYRFPYRYRRRKGHKFPEQVAA